jgi:ubiquinone/menaquinone biosynthesis C-methylase UbiE
MSIVFDRAADYYDETRAMPPELADAPIEALIRGANLQPDAQVLEIGVGTGRIAILLAQKIRRMTGVDLSLGMMEVLQRKKVGTAVQIDLAQADAVRLPFPGGCFDLIYATHVLHLVQGWREAVVEARRALKPGGCFVVSWHYRNPDSPNAQLRKELHRLAEQQGVSTKRPGAQSEEEIFQELVKWGATPRVLNVLDWSEPTTPGQILEELDRQIFSETWMIPRPVMDAVMPQLRAWAEQKYGNLNREIISPFNFRWLLAYK